MTAYYDLARAVTGLVKCVSDGGDEDAVDGYRRHVRNLLRELNSKEAYSSIQLNLVFRDLFSMPLETKDGRNAQLRCFGILKDLYGEDHLVLSDLCINLADGYIVKEYYAEALEFTGQALLIRVNRYGVMHEQTADCHFNLGILYRLLGDAAKSRQELYICRGIRSKLNTEGSLSVAVCDFHIGHTERQAEDPIAAYVCYYRCYRARYLLLGEEDALTKEAEALALKHRMLHGERLVASLELRQRVFELQWNASATRSWQYSVAVFVGRLRDDEALTLHQMQLLVMAAIRFSDARLSTMDTMDTMETIETMEDRDSPAAPVVVPLAARSKAEQEEQVSILVSMLMMIPKPLSLPSTSTSTSNTLGASGNLSSPPKRGAEGGRGVGFSNSLDSNASSIGFSPASSAEMKTTTASEFSSTAGTTKEPPKLRSRSPPSGGRFRATGRTTSSTGSGGVGGDNADDDDDDDDSDKARRNSARKKSKSKSNSPSKLTLNDRKIDKKAVIVENEASVVDGGDTAVSLAAVAAVVGEGEQSRNPFLPDAEGKKNEDGADTMNTTGNVRPELSSNFVQKAMNMQRAPAAATAPGEIEAEILLASLQNGGAGSEPVSPNRDTWRPIRSPFHTLAWSQSNQILQVDFVFGAGTGAGAGSAVGSNSSPIFARDRAGQLLLIQRANRSTLQAALKLKITALTMLPWLSKAENTTTKSPNRKSLRASAARTNTTTVAGGGGGGGGGGGISKDTVTMDTLEPSEDKKPDPKAALNALFGKKAPMGANASSGVTASSSKKAEESDASQQQEGPKLDPKAALTALFANKGKQLSSAPPPPSGGGKGVGAAAAGAGGGKWAAEIPAPPPVPYCWPPEPFTREDEEAAEGEGLVSTIGGGGASSSAVAVGQEGRKGSVIKVPGANDVPKGPKLKQIYLVSLPSIEGTLWESAGEESLITPEELFDDVEAEFTLDKPKKKKVSEIPFGGAAGAKKGGALGSGSGKAAPTDSILDPQRAQNINIMLAKFGKKNYFDLAKAIQNFDAQTLGSSAITSMAQFVPSPDEIAKVTAFVLRKQTEALLRLREQKRKEAEAFNRSGGGEGEGGGGGEAAAIAEDEAQVPLTPKDIDAYALAKLKLGKAEQYLFIFAQVKKLETRLSAMSSSLSAKETSKAILASAETMLNAVSEIRGSGRLKFLLKSFLDLNNALARSGRGEKLSGIKLDSLEKISQTKSNSGDTVEQYVVNKISKHFPEALQVSKDMPSLDDARGVMFPRLNADLKKLADGITMMKAIIELDNVPPPPGGEGQEGENSGAETMEGEEGQQEGDPAAMGAAAKNPAAAPSTLIEKALHEAEDLYTTASKQLEDAHRDFGELCTYFGEDATTDPDKLFGQIIHFVRGIQTAAKAAAAKNKKSARPKIVLPNMIN